MAIDSDVLVIGSGLAGMTAAAAAARGGARVRIVAAGESTLRSASGLIDVLGYLPENGPLADPFGAIGALPATHPYRRLGPEAIRNGLALFDEHLDRYRGAHTPRNALVPTVAGHLKPTARYPASTAPGLASVEKDCLLVGFAGLPAFDAPLAAARLRAIDVPFRVRGTTISFPVELRADAAATRYARALETNELVDSTPCRAALAAAIDAELDDESRVGLPAVLGDGSSSAVRSAMSDRLDTAVFEIPMGPPSLIGKRLQEDFEAALDQTGVSRRTGVHIGEVDVANDRITAVYSDQQGRRVPYSASEFILATGGLVGKGIDSNRRGVREPLFDCHVQHSSERDEWFVDDVYGDHPFARFGVRIDAQSRPLDADGTPEFENLRAAGAVVGGANFPAEKSGSGISLATGFVAGSRAAEAA